MELECAVKTYAWGKKGESSIVAQLARSSQPSFEIDPNQTYAELWMGTHPSGPSLIKSSGKNLAEWIQEHPDCLGPQVGELFGKKSLPFLFKVLSVDKALSIQTHPAKAHAEKLHALYPDLYPDPNHKPEIAIALTEFKALCGFRPFEDIKASVKAVPELESILGEDIVNTLVQCKEDADAQKTALKVCFTALMTSSSFQSSLQKLIDRLSDGNHHDDVGTDLKALILKLHSTFPGDIGCLAVFFLNYLTLSPGQSIYLAPNEPHAYLYGDCVECMACSDNVVRAGLTPKYIDVGTLCEMLSYSCRPPEANLFTPSCPDPFLTFYNPPIPDFAVYQIKIPSALESYEGPKVGSAAILLTIKGKATLLDAKLKAGSVLFIPWGSPLIFQDISSDGFLAYLACCVF